MTHNATHGTLPSTTAALHGIVVLDFSHVIAGPFATYYLAALGARVIKVENPHRGDSMRGKPQAFESLNHGKEVVQIDLTTDSGQAKAWELFAEADIFVDNMRPGVLERFGFGAAALRKKKPSLIHCAISGYGRQGEWASRPTFDHVVQAASGMTLLSGKEGDDPIKVGFPVIDSASGMLGALGIIAAIRRRDLTGEGESIDVSMMGAAMQLMYSMTVESMATGKALGYALWSMQERGVLYIVPATEVYEGMVIGNTTVLRPAWLRDRETAHELGFVMNEFAPLNDVFSCVIVMSAPPTTCGIERNSIVCVLPTAFFVLPAPASGAGSRRC